MESPQPQPQPQPQLMESDTSSTKRGSNKRKEKEAGQVQPFRGVRKRRWGSYVSEIRLPGQKARIWLGSFGSAEMAARAYDSAALFLKGNLACLNFPDMAHSLPRPDSSSRRDIQSAAAKAALLREEEEEDLWCGFDIDIDLDLDFGTSNTLSFQEVNAAADDVELSDPLRLSSLESVALPHSQPQQLALLTSSPTDDDFFFASYFPM